jgi:hypothetical protein
MTMDVASTRRTGAIGFGDAEGVDGVRGSAPDVELPTIAQAASEAEVRAFLSESAARLRPVVGELGDPESAIMAVARLVEQSAMQANRSAVDSNRVTRQLHMAAQAEAAAKAAKNEETAGFWSMFAKIAGYIAAVAGVVASIASCVVTGPGGVAGAAAIIGAVAGGIGLLGSATADITNAVAPADAGGRTASGALAFGASILGVISSVLGVISNPLNVINVIGASVSIAGQTTGVFAQGIQLGGGTVPPELMWLAAGLSVGGAAVSVGSLAMGVRMQGVGASTASQVSAAARSAAQTTKTVAAVTQGSAQVFGGVGEGVSAVHSHMASNDRVEARGHERAFKRALEALNDLVDDLRDLAESIARQRGRGLEVGSEQRRGQSNLTRNLVRA